MRNDDNAGDIGVIGQSVMSMVNGFQMAKDVVENFLIAEGIGARDGSGAYTVEMAKWYPQKAFMRVFYRVKEGIGESVLFNVGKAVPENAIFPPWVQDIESAMKAIDIAYHMNHSKNGIPMFNPDTGEMQEGIGHYAFKKIEGENRITIECSDYYPCLFDNGIIFAMATKFEKKALVGHDDTKPCREKGGDTCTYGVTW
jgi:hypothetical protein